ncbi:hypothetical protein HAZT_HAZT008302 [Hyalella azteca]|uniref:Uncharacterized protein n=1 Tax=Hyalella azteca TaxID=294128 RepID=A0A6A0H0D1_HYAAZ|nr:hypothetical protein HAZT_HAZT008302 [Hyalella azteca]
MVIVLLFILVYCCSGASPCSNTDISSTEVTSVLPDVTRRVLRNSVQPRTQRPGSREQNVTRGDHRSRSPAVIVPMMCSGDENYNGPYHSKGKRKPPAYEDLYQAPPPYATRTHTPSPNQVAVFPPPYEDSCKDCKLTFDLENCFDYLREASFSKNPDNASKSESETPGRTDPPAETASSPTLSAIITMSGADIPMSGADIPLSGADTPMLGAGIPMLGAETPMTWTLENGLQLFLLESRTWTLENDLQLVHLESRTWTLENGLPLVHLESRTWTLENNLQLVLMESRTWMLENGLQLVHLESRTWTLENGLQLVHLESRTGR